MSAQEGKRVVRETVLNACVAAVGLGVILAASHNYLLFHSLVEVFSVVVACSTFVVFWNARRFLQNGFFLFIGIAYLYVGILDLLHALAYEGMGIFDDSGANLATQLWLCARFVQAVSLLLAPLFFHRKLEPYSMLAAHAAATALLLGMVFYWQVFPTCFVEGTGLTTFKILSEYAVSLTMGAGLGLVVRRRAELDQRVFYLLAASIAVTIAAELAFTLYASPYGAANYLGHLLRLLSFYLVYKAIVEVGLTKPYSLLFRDLKRQEEALRQADRRKDGFLAMIAHEIRNWLAPIRNALEVLRRHRTDEAAARRALDIVHRQLQQIARLVDDLMDVSRISRGKLELKRRPIDLVAVLSQAIETGRPAIDAQGHEFTASLPPQPVWVEADPDRLAQVFTNLLINAAKYTDPGGRIALGLIAENGRAVVRVRDTGVGIPAEMLPRVFEPFLQAEQPGDRPGGGLGLGLTLVRRLVQMHHGTVEVASPGPGLGSEFVVRLPVREVAPVSSPSAAAGKARAATPPAPGCDVLVVDDHPDAARMLALLLEDLGHRVRTAGDGPAALAAIREAPPQIVLLDIALPGMDGYEVARQVRREHGDRVRLVAMTGFGEPEDLKRCRQAGFDQHFLKPIDLDKLAALLAELGANG